MVIIIYNSLYHLWMKYFYENYSHDQQIFKKHLYIYWIRDNNNIFVWKKKSSIWYLSAYINIIIMIFFLQLDIIIKILIMMIKWRSISYLKILKNRFEYLKRRFIFYQKSEFSNQYKIRWSMRYLLFIISSYIVWYHESFSLNLKLISASFD